MTISNKKKDYANGSQLGKLSNNTPLYSSSLLYPIMRTAYRKTIPNYCDAKFGFDRWVCYELSWLNDNGLPKVSMIEIIIPLSSDTIIESKSLNELTDLVDEIIKNLENENNLENTSEDYTNLLKINRLIEKKFQKNFKEISDKTNFKIKDIKSNNNAKKVK